MDKMVKNQFAEFLSIGPSDYCKRYHLQACHLCTRIECGDNTNPVVIELLVTKKLLNESIEQTEHSQKNTSILLKLVNEMKGYLR